MKSLVLLISLATVTSHAGTGDGLSHKEINSVVKEHRGDIRDCYDELLKRNAKAKGKLTMAFTIDGQGNLSEVKVVTNDIGDEEVAKCVSKKFGAWKFPKAAKPTVVDDYPVFLMPYSPKGKAS